MSTLSLTTDELLSTTRAVRRRLDLTRPVSRELVEECLRLGLQAPTASNRQNTHFVVVTDPEKRAALGDVYRRGVEVYRKLPQPWTQSRLADPQHAASMPRVATSAAYLAQHIQEVPVYVIPCTTVRTEGQPIAVQAAVWGSVLPSTWSFMLAARVRGLGTCWTTLHLFFEEEAARILGIPYREVMQAALIPVAYTRGTDFKPAYREPVERFVHWDAW
jgi:nitroreductase